MTRVFLTALLLCAFGTPPAARLRAHAADDGRQNAAPPRALDAMLGTERAFARLGAEVGARDSFLVYFAEDAVILDDASRPAREAIRGWPAPKPGAKLLWEPRTGDIATSGDLGYLTGPVTTVAPDGTRWHSCYLSVWKRQPDGNFKVVLDAGVTTPGPAEFAPGFTRGFDVPRYAGAPDAAEARASLEKTERVLDSTARAGAAADAFGAVLTPNARFDRVNVMPLVGKPTILAWLSRQANMPRTDTDHVETAASGDVGYTWGSYTMGRRGEKDRAGAAGTGAANEKEERGHYVRVWGRNLAGKWQILIDLAKPSA